MNTFLLALTFFVSPLLQIYPDWRAEQTASRASVADGDLEVLGNRNIGPDWLLKRLGSHTRWLERADQAAVFADGSGAGLKRLAEFHHLTELSIDGNGRFRTPTYRVTDGDLAPLSKLTDLQSLKIWNTDCTDSGLASLRGMKDLRTLCLINDPNITGSGLEALAHDNRLRVLSLSGIPLHDADLERLQISNKDLVQVELWGAKLTTVGRRRVAALPNLTELTIGASNLTDRDISDVTLAVKVKSLSLAENQIAGSTLGDLSCMKSLHLLQLSKNPVGDSAMLKIVELPTLAWLFLDATDVTDVGVKTLAKMPRLEHIDLQDTKVTDACIDDLARMPALTYIDLRQAHFTPGGIKRLQEKCPNLSIESP